MRPFTTMSDQLNYELFEITDNFVYGQIQIPDMIALANEIDKEASSAEFEPASIGNHTDDAEPYLDIRSSSVIWLKNSLHAMEVVQELVEDINDTYFNLPIFDPPPEYQYTVYKNVDDHYDWHRDFYPEDSETSDYKRNVSLSLCLSPAEMYQGAELFIKDGTDLNVRVFKMRFGDFLIFPSDVEHRVNALRSGVRASLVVWYGQNLI